MLVATLGDAAYDSGGDPEPLSKDIRSTKGGQLPKPSVLPAEGETTGLRVHRLFVHYHHHQPSEFGAGLSPVVMESAECFTNTDIDLSCG